MKSFCFVKAEGPATISVSGAFLLRRKSGLLPGHLAAGDAVVVTDRLVDGALC